MNPDEDGRPVTDDQWEKLNRIEEKGYAWIVKGTAGANTITKKMAQALIDRGLLTVTGTTRAELTAAGRAAVKWRARTGR